MLCICSTTVNGVVLAFHTESLHPDSNHRYPGIGSALLFFYDDQNIGRLSSDYHATWMVHKKRKKLREINSHLSDLIPITVWNDGNLLSHIFARNLTEKYFGEREKYFVKSKIS